MADPTVYKNPNTVTYDTTPVTGCTSITVNDTASPQTSMSDDGTLTHWVTKGSASGALNFHDPVQASGVAKKTAASKTLTFKVTDAVNASKTVTITNIKTGGVNGNYTLNAAGAYSVSFVADSVSNPT